MKSERHMKIEMDVKGNVINRIFETHEEAEQVADEGTIMERELKMWKHLLDCLK